MISHLLFFFSASSEEPGNLNLVALLAVSGDLSNILQASSRLDIALVKEFLETFSPILFFM